ncbi:hypothetical protein [Anabaena azotica]
MPSDRTESSFLGDRFFAEKKLSCCVISASIALWPNLRMSAPNA